MMPQPAGFPVTMMQAPVPFSLAVYATAALRFGLSLSVLLPITPAT